MSDAPGNLFFCPYSIRTTLLMTFAGAQGETARQMTEVLQVPEPASQTHEAVRAWHASLNGETHEQTGYQLHTANALWGQQGFLFQPAFVKQLETFYGGGLREVDFAHAVEDARQTINAWIETETEGKIVEFLKPKMLDASATLVLTNSVYFKGAWEAPFDRQKTTNAPFYLTQDESVEVPMMSQIMTTSYGEDEVHRVLELPYAGERLSMVLVVPKQPDGLRQVEQQLSATSLAGLLQLLQSQKVMVTIPRWSMEVEVSLPDILWSMGMRDAFALPPADFSGMTGKKNVFISAVLHKAMLDVNEEGSEAVAATEVTMARGLRRYPEFVADRPFLLLIRDRQTGGMLFLGRVVDPRG
jgi:serpin B